MREGRVKEEKDTEGKGRECEKVHGREGRER